MKKRVFTTSDIARICHYSGKTVSRWLEKGEINGYHVGTSGHWRVLPKDFALFLKNNNITFPEPAEIGIDLKSLMDIENKPTFCWEFYKNEIYDHINPDQTCDDCLVYKVRSNNCYVLRKKVGHKEILCSHSCEDCAYFHFHQKEILPKI